MRFRHLFLNVHIFCRYGCRYTNIMWSAINRPTRAPTLYNNNNIMQSVTDLRANKQYTILYITVLVEILSLPYCRLNVSLTHCVFLSHCFSVSLYRSPREYFGFYVENNAAAGSPSSSYTHYTQYNNNMLYQHIIYMLQHV